MAEKQIVIPASLVADPELRHLLTLLVRATNANTKMRTAIAAVTAATGGSTIDAEARTALNALITAAQG